MDIIPLPLRRHSRRLLAEDATMDIIPQPRRRHSRRLQALDDVPQPQLRRSRRLLAADTTDHCTDQQPQTQQQQNTQADREPVPLPIADDVTVPIGRTIVRVPHGHAHQLPGITSARHPLPSRGDCVWTLFGSEWFLGWVIQRISRSPPIVRIIYAADDDDQPVELSLRHTWRLAQPSITPYGLAADVLTGLARRQTQIWTGRRQQVAPAGRDVQPRARPQIDNAARQHQPAVAGRV